RAGTEGGLGGRLSRKVGTRGSRGAVAATTPVGRSGARVPEDARTTRRSRYVPFIAAPAFRRNQSGTDLAHRTASTAAAYGSLRSLPAAALLARIRIPPALSQSGNAAPGVATRIRGLPLAEGAGALPCLDEGAHWVSAGGRGHARVVAHRLDAQPRPNDHGIVSGQASAD